MRWLARGEHGIPPGTAWLHEREAARAAGMRFTKRRTEYLLRRYAGKAAVAAEVGLPESELGRIAVLNQPTGAPFVEIDGAPCDLEISLSDRAGWAVCLVGEGLADVGVDLEIAEPRSAGFIRDYLTTAEQEFVGDLPAGPERDAAANLIWSAKEAALKVLRTGLAVDTRTVEIAVSGVGSGEGWQPLTARLTRELPAVPERFRHLVPDTSTFPPVLPGWWRRDGVFLLTTVTTRAGAPATALPGNADLAVAAPIESWRERPLVSPESGS